MTTTAKKTTAKKSTATKAAPSPALIAVGAGKGITFRGARAAWWETLQAWNGKPLTDFLAHINAGNHPTVPKSGKAENPTGWVKFFMRTKDADGNALLNISK